MIAIALLTLGCNMASSPPMSSMPDMDHPADDDMAAHMARMGAIRDTLKAKLGPAYDQPVAGLDHADPARGKATYDRACTPCHGALGKGDGPAAKLLPEEASDFTDPMHAAFYSDAGRVAIIRDGLPKSGMPGWAGGTISDPDLLDLYAYVRSLRP